MLLKLTCFLTFLVFLAHGQSPTTNLDFSSECARIADYQETEKDYCWNFNTTCRTIFDKKQVCQSMKLSCSQQLKSGSCVLIDCKEYTPDMEIRKFEDQMNEWAVSTPSQWRSVCSMKFMVMPIPPFIEKTEYDEKSENKENYCCSIMYRRLEEKGANLCRNTTDASKSCDFYECSPVEMKQKEEEKVDKQTVRLTAVSDKDIDVTDLAIDAVFHAYSSHNLTREFCQHFHNRCMQMIDQYFGDGDFEMKESTCIPDINGKVAQTACIVIRKSDVDSNEIKEEVEQFEGTTATGETLDVTEMAVEFAKRYSKDNGSYCENFIEGCTMIVNLQNIVNQIYQSKEITCNKCLLVKSSETIGSQILAEHSQPITNVQRKLRLTEETEHLFSLKFDGYCIKAAYNIMMHYDLNQKIKYFCARLQKNLEARIENVCKDEHGIYESANGPFQSNCNFHRCTQQEEQEKKPISDLLTVRHTTVSNKDIDVTALARDMTLMDDTSFGMGLYSTYCREFRSNCGQILDHYFYNKMDYQVKENTCHREKISRETYDGRTEMIQRVPSKSACILVRVGDK